MISLTLAGTAWAQEERPPYAQMSEALATAAARHDLPQQLDPTTKLVDVRASGLTMTYFYEVNEHATADQTRRFFAQNNIPIMCADEDVVYSFRQGVTFRYSYKTLAEPAPVVIVVGAADCEGQ